jgi:hypothetical protein
MRLPRQIRTSIVLVLGTACVTDDGVRPRGPFVYSAVTRTCGPADGPAVAIYLTTVAVRSLQPPAPYVRIVVQQPIDQVVGTWRIGRNEVFASALYARGTNDFEMAERGEVIVNAVEGDNTLRGSADVTFPSAGRVSGTFRGEWIPSVELCG